MKKFIESIQKKDRDLNQSYTKKEYKNILQTMNDLEKDHQLIKDDLKKINYLLELIEKHSIHSKNNGKTESKSDVKKWLSDLKKVFEKMHLISTDVLTKEDIKFLETEKYNLEEEKKHLEKKHKYIHTLIAKSNAYLMDVRNDLCKELTHGETITEVSQKLLDKFGKHLKENNTYEHGRREMVKYMQNIFDINKIAANKVFDLLEDAKILYYDVNPAEIYEYPDFENFSEFTDLNYVPLFGTWYINA